MLEAEAASNATSFCARAWHTHTQKRQRKPHRAGLSTLDSPSLQGPGMHVTRLLWLFFFNAALSGSLPPAASRSSPQAASPGKKRASNTLLCSPWRCRLQALIETLSTSLLFHPLPHRGGLKVLQQPPSAVEEEGHTTALICKAPQRRTLCLEVIFHSHILTYSSSYI